MVGTKVTAIVTNLTVKVTVRDRVMVMVGTRQCRGGGYDRVKVMVGTKVIDTVTVVTVTVTVTVTVMVTTVPGVLSWR